MTGTVGKIVKGVVRAAIARPWDYQGDGAPNDHEMRVSPDEAHYAAFSPARGTWLIHDEADGRVVAEVANLSEMDQETAEWRSLVSVEDSDE